jgi:hypothetical protein
MYEEQERWGEMIPIPRRFRLYTKPLSTNLPYPRQKTIHCVAVTLINSARGFERCRLNVAVSQDIFRRWVAMICKSVKRGQRMGMLQRNTFSIQTALAVA